MSEDPRNPRSPRTFEGLASDNNFARGDMRRLVKVHIGPIACHRMPSGKPRVNSRANFSKIYTPGYMRVPRVTRVPRLCEELHACTRPFEGKRGCTRVYIMLDQLFSSNIYAGSTFSSTIYAGSTFKTLEQPRCPSKSLVSLVTLVTLGTLGGMSEASHGLEQPRFIPQPRLSEG